MAGASVESHRSFLRRGAQPRRIFGARGCGYPIVHGRGAYGPQPWQVHARGSAGRRGGHGCHPRAVQREVCQAANLNSPDQTVISGNKAAVERAAELAKHRGAKRAIMLPVSAPFHCALMQPAQDRLAEDLRALTFHAPEVPLMCNVDASLVTTAEQARDALIRQVTGAVQWDKSMRGLAALPVHNFAEVGPGKVLCGLLRQIC